MVSIFLLIDVNKASFRAPSSRGIDAFTRGVVPKVVDPGNTLQLRNLLAGLRVEDRQHRSVARAIEQTMMALIERQRDIPLDSCDRPGCDLFALLSIDYA